MMNTVLPPQNVKGAGSGEIEKENAQLSFEQENIWVLHQVDGGVAYNMPIAYRLRGEIDLGLLKRSLAEVAKRHPALQLRFRLAGGEPRQFRSGTTEIEVLDHGRVECALNDEQAQGTLNGEAKKPFDLENGPPLRLGVFRFRDASVLVLTLYHIVGDHSSLVTICNELSEIYSALQVGKTPTLPSLEGDFISFARQQREEWDEARSANAIAFWRKKLEGKAPESYLPPDFAPGPTPQKPGHLHLFEIPAKLVEQLKGTSRAHGGTMFMTLLAAFKALLHRYSGQEEVVVGVPIDQRPEHDLPGAVGFFIRTLPFRTSLQGDPSFAEMLGRIRETTIGATRHGNVPLSKVADAMKAPRSIGKNPFFSVVFQYLAEPNPELKLPGVEAQWLPIHTETSKFDLTFTLVAEKEKIYAEVEFDSSLYRKEAIENFCKQYLKLLAEAAQNPARKLSEINLLDEAEFQRVVREFNQTQSDYPRDKTIHQLFSEQAAAFPTRIALSCGGEQLTYAALEERTNQWANLFAGSAKPGGAIGVLLERGIEAVTTMLAILKAGCAYVPLDPKMPLERITEITGKAKISVIITNSTHAPKAPRGVQALLLDGEQNRLQGASNVAPSTAVHPEDGAYILFTSGSTGGPKGVKVPHRAVVRLVRNTNFARFGPEEVFLQLAHLSFDASTLEIWGALLNGGRTAIFPGELSSLQELAKVIAEEKVSTLWLTAGLFNQVIDENAGALKGVKQLLAGGDVLSVAHILKAQTLLPDCTIVNGYGPTENTTFTTCYRIPARWGGGRSVPIGKPISNTQVFILDSQMRPAPVGIPGELWAAGDGLALGYMEDAEATAKAFVENPFKPFGGERLYRTGDSARWLPDGNIEFLGRTDQQVKIRGFRMELGEIEGALRQHPEVQDCALSTRNANAEEKCLAAYVVRKSGKIEAAQLRTFLSEKLPSYMVPSHFLFLDRLPINTSGKVDRKALAQIPLVEEKREFRLENVTDPVQLQILAIWREVLKHHEFGVNDNFFDLGGHSLLAVKMVSRVNSAFGTNLTMRTVFQAPTVARLAVEVASVRGQTIPGPILRRRTNEAARLLENLNSLSDEEIDRLLKEKTA